MRRALVILFGLLAYGLYVEVSNRIESAEPGDLLLYLRDALPVSRPIMPPPINTRHGSGFYIDLTNQQRGK